MAVGAVAEPPFATGSTTELDSILGHSPVKENEGGRGLGGGYGYSGIGQNSSAAYYNGRSNQELEISTPRAQAYTYQPHRRDNAEISDDVVPTHKQGGSDSSHVVHRRGPSNDVNRTDGLPYLQSNPYDTPTQQTFDSPQRQWQPSDFPPPSSATQQQAEPSRSSPPRKVDTNVPATPQHSKKGVSLTDRGPTSPAVSMNSAHTPKRSVELRSGHVVGRSFRASIEDANEYSPSQGHGY
jgi:hypothetical protein